MFSNKNAKWNKSAKSPLDGFCFVIVETSLTPIQSNPLNFVCHHRYLKSSVVKKEVN